MFRLCYDIKYNHKGKNITAPKESISIKDKFKKGSILFKTIVK